MNKKNIKEIIISSLWGIIPGLMVSLPLLRILAGPRQAWDPRFRLLGYTTKEIGLLALIVLGTFLLVLIANTYRHVFLHQHSIGPFIDHNDVLRMSADKRKAQSHPIPTAYLSQNPDGLTVGAFPFRCNRSWQIATFTNNSYYARFESYGKNLRDQRSSFDHEQ